MEKNQTLELYLWDKGNGRRPLRMPTREALRKARHIFYAKWDHMPTHVGMRNEAI